MYIFSEIQKFRQWWIWLTVSVPYLVMLIVFLFVRSPEKEAVEPEFWIILGLVPLVGAFVILLLKLHTEIDNKKIRFRYTPFHFRHREIDWSDIEKAYVREYKPLREYGGWGIRYGGKNGKAYNVRGNKGLQLELKNGKKILIGTQKPEELELVLVQLRKNKL